MAVRIKLVGDTLDEAMAAIPDELPDGQKQLVDVAALGLRAILGYTGAK